MSEKITKIIIVTLLVLILFSAVGFVYYFIFGGSGPTTTPETGPATQAEGIFPTATPNQPVKPAGQTTTRNPNTGEISVAQNGEIPSGNTGVAILDTNNISQRPTTAPFFITRQNPTTKIKTLFVRYMERGTGHTYELIAGQNEAKKISDTTLTKVYETLWGQNGKTLIIRRLSDAGLVENLYGYIEEAGTGLVSTQGGSTTTGATVGKINSSAIAGEVKAVAVSPDQSKFFYLNKIDGDIIGYVSDLTGKTLATKKSQVFSSPIGSWNVSWPNTNIISLLTKPSFNIPGSLYFLTLKTQGVDKILSGINGLTTLVSPDAKRVLYTSSGGGSISTYIYNVAINESLALPIKTFADKCTWSKFDSNLIYCAIPTEVLVGNYPDDWYQGTSNLTDEIWTIDVKTLKTELVAGRNLFQKGGGIDAESLSLSEDEGYIAFTNKKNSTPWIIKTR